jgi:hypothetical protein
MSIGLLPDVYSATQPFFYEIPGSRRSTSDFASPTMTVNGVVIGTDDETAAKQTADDGSYDTYFDPLTNRTLLKKSIDAEDIGPQTWGVTLEYALANRDDPNPASTAEAPIFSFDTTGCTTHITNAIAQQSYPVTGTNWVVAPNCKNLIGVTRDNVEGVDVVIPTLKYSETQTLDSSVVNPVWIAAIAGITGTTNLNPWRIWAANQALFLGASGQSQPDGLVKVDLHFEIGINANNLTVLNTNGIVKNAHDYLWTWNMPAFDSLSGAMIHQPQTIYVAQVYQSADWSSILN